MSITNDLFKNSYDIKGASALTATFTYTYEDLVENIKEYEKLLKQYKRAGFDRIAVIVKDKIEFSTISLILALIQCEISPIIISEEIGENIRGILAKEDALICFYESLLKPQYLEKLDVVIDERLQYFVTANPNINVKNKRKTSSFKWYLDFINSKQGKSGICKLYDIKNGKIEEELITESDINMFAKSFSGLHDTKWEYAITSLPLYSKQGFLFATRALSSDMHLVSTHAKNFDKKLAKKRPSIISVDKYLLNEFITNPKFKNLDLSLVNKVIVDVEPEQILLVQKELEKRGFTGGYIVNTEPQEQKIIKL